jgi:acyl transferase domain-containing protein/NAD(P)H-dependent flavin oxidoreductase YrpB (nitropropane dioxygenase family)/NAD(P)-dependent dehydrogenase (short-subunit alcohol dehydrogenase family)/4'-phosphopantetheinyl transferase EntD/acyl carrier protein
VSSALEIGTLFEHKDYIFWVALPPMVDDPGWFAKAAGLAEPLLDLRYGPLDYKKSILEKSLHLGLNGLTVFVDSHDKGLNDLLLRTLPCGSRVILTSVEWNRDDVVLLMNRYKKSDIVLGVEVDGRDGARQAQASGIDFLVVSGHEAYGFVSVKTNLILIQEIVPEVDIPLVIRGSLGSLGAAAAYAAGCSGCILDSQLLLLSDSPLSQDLKERLVNISPCDTAVIGGFLNYPYRLFFKNSRDEYNVLADREKTVFLGAGSLEEKRTAFKKILDPIVSPGFSKDSRVLPVGQGIVFSQEFFKKRLGVREVLKVYGSALRDSIASVKTSFPFLPQSSLAQFHKVQYPIVQGPMACVSHNSRLAKEVAKEGALPFIALAGLASQESRQLLRETRSVLGGASFGAGIVGFSPEEAEEQVSAVLDEPPDFIIVAGGDPDLVRRLERAGIPAYIHTPTVTHLNNCFDNQIRGIILEGHEAGGHIGSLGSLILWELGVSEIVTRDSAVVASLRILLAGGIVTARGALAAAVLVAPVIQQGASVGLQVGTAYLMTDEAVASGAVPGEYQRALLNGNETVITGQTVNLPTQWLSAPALSKIITTEIELEKQDIPLAERKKRVELMSFCCLHKSMGNSRANLSEDCPGDSSVLYGGYMCGQAVAAQKRAIGIKELHEDLTWQAQKFAESCLAPLVVRDTMEDAVAIIGMGCIFPDADNPREYWENIVNRHSAIREVPRDRWDPDLFYSPGRDRAFTTYSKICAVIEGFKKDPLKFNIPPVSEPFIERMQFIMLEVTHQALEDAGYLKKNFSRERTAVYVGSAGNGDLTLLYQLQVYARAFIDSLPRDLKPLFLDQVEKIFKPKELGLSEDTCGGVFGSIVASRINNCFNLGGTSLLMDAACASSLAAVDMGVKGLKNREFDLVLAGGVDVNLNILSFVFFSSLGALSAKGSFPFDERADGFVLGEGAGMLLLKRFDDAVRDGDKIYAIIRSIGTSSDGRAKGITAPDVKGQINALERAYEKVPFAPDAVSLVEAHGTGTWQGDTVEMASLTQFFQKYSGKKKFIGLGSVKSMIGHLKAASGIAGIIKMALALHNRVLPPTINCEYPRKDVDWENSPFYLITESRPWKDCCLPRRAVVDAFGFGGVNYHAVLEEAPAEGFLQYGVVHKDETVDKFSGELFIFRAPTRRELLELVEKTKNKCIVSGRLDFREIADQLRASVSSAGPILTIVAVHENDLVSNLKKSCHVLRDESRSEFFANQGIYFSETPLEKDEKVVFLFPGFGSQYLHMGGDLPVYFPCVKEIFQKVDAIAFPLTGGSLLNILLPENKVFQGHESWLADFLVRPDYIHGAMMALEMGILEVLVRAGVRPDMVVGHSLGEFCALYAADVFDAQAAVLAAITRGRLILDHGPQNGAMVGVHASVETLKSVLRKAPGLVVVASKNCPAQTVIAGEARAVGEARECLVKKGFLCQQIPTTFALHTSLLADCVKPFCEFLNTLSVNLPQIPVYSNLTGRAHKADSHFASYLRQTLPEHLVHPVEFIENILSLYEAGARFFVEVGPESTLSSFVDNILVDKPHWTVVTNLSHRSASVQLLHALAFCVTKGLPVNLSAVMPLRRPRALKRTTSFSSAKTFFISGAAKSESPSATDFMREALADQKEDVVDDYLKQRGDFIKDMVRLDFQNFKEGAISDVAEKESTHDHLEELIIGLISRKTGYPPDVIKLDFDVEAELGLDSIKQVEIIREVALALDINFGEDTKSQRFKISTPRKLIEVCRECKGQKAVKKQDEPLVRRSHGHVAATDKDWFTDCHRWVSEKIETPFLDQGDPGMLKGKRVLLLADEGGLADSLKGRLEQAGAIVSVVDPADPPKRLPEGPDLILDMSAYGAEEVFLLDKAEDWWRQTAQHADFILRVSKELILSLKEDRSSRVFWVEITSLGGELGAHAVDSVAARAGIGLGILRCLSCEFPDMLESLFLDFSPQEPLARVAECIFNELINPRIHSEIGYAQSKRFEICWKLDESPSQESVLTHDAHSVVLAIGGAKGITASICRGLAERSRAQFVIVGRKPILSDDSVKVSEPVSFEESRNMLLEQARAQGNPIVPAEVDAFAWEQVWKAERSWNMKNLRRIAKNVTYRQCDITDVESVRLLVDELRQKYGRIDLVIQGASDLIEKSTEDIDMGEFIDNMKSKALGTACLLSALSTTDVGTFINFSSVAGRWGNKGQSSYAVGHEVAAILVAGMREKRVGRWINVFFGPWLNIGMIRKGEVMERLRAKGSDFITHETGYEFFVKELGSGSSHNVAFSGNRSLRMAQISSQGAASKSRPMPLIDGVDAMTSTMVLVRRTFDLKRDLFVADHYVLYDTPIMPGIVSLEMLTQAASLLSCPEFFVTDIEDVVFLRPGIFPRREPRVFFARVQLVSRREDSNWFSGEMFSLFTPPGNTQGKEVCHVRCRMRFGRRDSPQRPKLLLVNTGIGDCRVDAKPLWGTKLRQGRQGMFQNFRSFSSVTRDGTVGEVLVDYSPQLGRCPWLDNILRLDGLLDLVNLSSFVFLGNRPHLVRGIRSIKFFSSDDSQKVCLCRSVIRGDIQEAFVYDAEAMDEKGCVRERITGVEKVLLPRHALYLKEPIWESVRENPWQKDIRRLLAYEGRFILAQIDLSLVEGVLEGEAGRLLSDQLTEKEIEHYHHLSHPKRRLEWLAGRIAAKGAVRMYLDKRAPFAREIEIQNLPDHSPCVVLSIKGDVLSLPHISISHSRDIAVAVAAATPGVGIDVEELSDSILEIADEFCSQEERECVIACSGRPRMTALALLWAMKESSRKAAGPENCSMKELVLGKTEARGDYIVCELYHANTGHVKSVAFCSGGYAYAVSRSLDKGCA